MKTNKLVLVVVGSFVFVAALALAVYVFRNEIAELFVDIKHRIEAKSLFKKGEFEDFADV